MGIAITLPADTKTPGSAGHTSDHNAIVDAVTAAFLNAFNISTGDTVTPPSEFDGGVYLGTVNPATPASGKSVIYSTSVGTPQVKYDSSLAGSIPATQTDVGTFTVTAAANTQFSKLWSVPANDANIGTVYRLTLWASGTQGSTQQTYTVTPLVDSTVLVGGNRTTVPSTLIAISTSFNVRAIYELLVLTTGAGGTVLPSIKVEITQNTGTPTTAQSMTIIAGPAASNSFDTTVSHTLSFDVSWGATTGAPTTTSKGTMFERLGVLWSHSPQ